MTALVFGDEKKPNPIPRIIRLTMIKRREESLPRNVSSTRPRVVKTIPMEAMMPGSILSERLPAIGEQIIMMMGCVTKIRPACSAVKPLMYWR